MPAQKLCMHLKAMVSFARQRFHLAAVLQWPSTCRLGTHIEGAALLTGLPMWYVQSRWPCDSLNSRLQLHLQPWLHHGLTSRPVALCLVHLIVSATMCTSLHTHSVANADRASSAGRPTVMAMGQPQQTAAVAPAMLATQQPQIKTWRTMSGAA